MPSLTFVNAGVPMLMPCPSIPLLELLLVINAVVATHTEGLIRFKFLKVSMYMHLAFLEGTSFCAPTVYKVEGLVNGDW